MAMGSGWKVPRSRVIEISARATGASAAKTPDATNAAAITFPIDLAKRKDAGRAKDRTEQRVRFIDWAVIAGEGGKEGEIDRKKIS